MLLAIDIGNSNIAVGGFQGQDLKFNLRLKTDSARTPDEYFGILRSLLFGKIEITNSFRACVISSVVPQVTSIFLQMLTTHFDLTPLVVGPGVKTGVSIHIADASAVGADRIVNALAAKTIYGCPTLVVDFGTAISFDLVGKDGAYEGGLIAPGPLSALESLVRNTAKLPRIDFAWPKTVIGKSTTAAMQSGLVVGFTCLIDGLVGQIESEFGLIDNVVATGTDCECFISHSKRIQHFNSELTLEGLRLLAQLNGL